MAAKSPKLKEHQTDYFIHQSRYGDDPNNFHIERYKHYPQELRVTVTYPNIAERYQVKYVVVDQESVRASDGIRISFDFSRNGYVIEQASTFSWQVDDPICDPDWQEVAFVPAWGRYREDD